MHIRRQFLESLNFKERNLVLTVDLYLEYNPRMYVLVYSYLQQVVNYPAIQQALPYIVQPTPPQSLLAAPTTPGSNQFFTPNNSPSRTPSALATYKTTSVPKLLKGVLCGKTIDYPDPLPDRPSWIQKTC